MKSVVFPCPPMPQDAYPISDIYIYIYISYQSDMLQRDQQDNLYGYVLEKQGDEPASFPTVSFAD